MKGAGPSMRHESITYVHLWLCKIQTRTPNLNIKDRQTVGATASIPQ